MEMDERLFPYDASVLLPAPSLGACSVNFTNGRTFCRTIGPQLSGLHFFPQYFCGLISPMFFDFRDDKGYNNHFVPSYCPDASHYATRWRLGYVLDKWVVRSRTKPSL